MKRPLRNVCIALFTLAVTILAGCSSSNYKPPISVSITSPATPPSIQQGQSVTITASVANDPANKGVTWTLSGQGTLSGQTATSVVYNAPASVTANMTATVTATSVSDTSKTASLAITVTPPPPISVTITNKITSITVGHSATLNAAVQNDPSNSGVSWTLTANGTACSPACGSLSGSTATSTTYTAPATVPPSPDNAPTITATSVTDTTKSDSDAFSIASTAPAGVIVTITNKISTITAGAAAVTFDAAVQNDSTNSGVTWTLVSGSPASGCEPTCGSLSSITTTNVTYTPPATVPASPNNTPTLIATSIADNTKSDSDTFTIVSTSANNDAELKGQYAFLISGWDDATGSHFAYIGSITADGNGNITSGLEDMNLPAGVSTEVPVTGTYTLGTDNRGTLVLTGSGLTTKFAFSAGMLNSNSIATKLHIIEFDDATGTSGRRGSGVGYLQDPSAFSLASITGPYAFQFIGQDNSAADRLVNTGSFTVNAGGAITGTVDSNDAGSFAGGLSITASLTADAATTTNGRLAFSFTSGAFGDSIFYIVSANHLLSMDSDLESSNGLTSGEILRQTSTSFTNSFLNGTVVLYSTGVSSVAGASYSQAGLLTFNSATGTGTISLDTNDGGTSGTLSSTFTYSVAAYGQVTINLPTGPGPDLYLIDTNKAFIMDEGANVNGGRLEPQAGGPFSNSSVNGNYFFGEAEAPATTSGENDSGVAASAGNGTLNFTSDSSISSGLLLSGQTQTPVLTIAATGRATDGSGNIYYIISPTRFVLFSSTSQQAEPIVAEQ